MAFEEMKRGRSHFRPRLNRGQGHAFRMEILGLLLSSPKKSITGEDLCKYAKEKYDMEPYTFSPYMSLLCLSGMVNKIPVTYKITPRGKRDYYEYEHKKKMEVEDASKCQEG